MSEAEEKDEDEENTLRCNELHLTVLDLSIILDEWINLL